MKGFNIITAVVLLMELAACAGNLGEQLRLNPPLAQGRFQDRVRVAQISRVAVLPFENLSPFEGASEKVADMFATALYGAKRFSVMERNEAVRRAQAQKLAVPFVLDRATALKIGRALQVDGVFIGTITEYQYLYFPEDAVVGLQVELLDVETGQVVWSGIFNDRHYGLLQGSDEPITSLAQQGTTHLVQLLEPPVNLQYPYTPVTPDLTQKPESLNANATP